MKDEFLLLKKQDRKMDGQDAKLDNLSAICEEHRGDLQQLHNLVADSMKELNAVKAERAKLKTSVNTINADLYELRQELLVNNIVVSGSGLKLEAGKSQMEKLKAVTTLLNYDLMDGDVSDIFSVKRRTGPILIVKLVSTTTKINLMETLRTQGMKAGTDGVPAELANIFFRDQLSVYYDHLYYKARLLKKKAKLHRTWTKLGKLYIREAEGSSQIRIRVSEDLIALYEKYGLEI
jgi:small-conductance mechanosensitive channel